MNLVSAKILEVAARHIGVRETGGNNCGPQIEAWLARVHQPPGKAWCMAFGWCVLSDALLELNLENPVRPCASVVRMFASIPDRFKSSNPCPGFGAFHQSAKDPTLGHFGWVQDVTPDGSGLWTIEGNTNPEGSRTGGGVYRHTPAVRPTSYFGMGFVDFPQMVIEKHQ